MDESVKDYGYTQSGPTWANAYLWPAIEKELRSTTSLHGAGRAFDLGCGNGATAGMLCRLGYEVVGVDPSQSGIEIARKTHPECRFDVASAYDNLAARYGTFDFVVSLEVIEHCYEPRRLAKTAFDLLRPGGKAIISTPYHGYWKNLALALTGKLDPHFTALWDGGHIKFFSIATLGTLLEETGFAPVTFRRVGRLPALAKSMIALAARPAA